MKTITIELSTIVMLLFYVGPLYAQGRIDDGTMRRQTAERIARSHRVRLNWRQLSLSQLLDAEARISTAARIRKTHSVSVDWRKQDLSTLLDAEARMNTASRISKRTGKRTDWRRHDLSQLLDMELQLMNQQTSRRGGLATGRRRQVPGTQMPRQQMPMLRPTDMDDVDIGVVPQVGATLSPGGLDQTERKGKYLGQWSANEFDPDSTSNPFGAGNEFSPNSIRNQFGPYGSKFSSKSPTNPFATDTPRLYDSQGNYRGKLSSNPYDPDSISNPYGRYGNPYSPDSVNNPFGAGNPFSPESPKNPFGKGLSIYGDE